MTSIMKTLTHNLWSISKKSSKHFIGKFLTVPRIKKFIYVNLSSCYKRQYKILFSNSLKSPNFYSKTTTQKPYVVHSDDNDVTIFTSNKNIVQTRF